MTPVQLDGIEFDNAAGVEAEYLEALRSGLAAMDCPRGVAVRVTDTFETDTEELLELAAFNAVRGGALVAARTAAVEDGFQILVNADALGHTNLAGAARLAAREAGQVLMKTRGEDQLDSSWLWTGERVLRTLAVKALTEFRVELAVFRAGFAEAQDVSWEHAGETVDQLNTDIVVAGGTEEFKEPARLVEAITETHDWSAGTWSRLAAGVVAGAVADGPPAEMAPEQRASWDDYVASTWEHRLGLYQAVPDAREEFDERALSKTVDRLMVVERHYLWALGFRFRDRNAEDFRFDRVRDEDLFMTRFRRAEQALARRDREFDGGE